MIRYRGVRRAADVSSETHMMRPRQFEGYTTAVCTVGDLRRVSYLRKREVALVQVKAMSTNLKSASSSVSSERSKRGGGIFGLGLFHRVIDNSALRSPAAVAPLPESISAIKPVEYTPPLTKNLIASPSTSTPATKRAGSSRAVSSPPRSSDDALLRNSKPSWLCRTKAFQNACNTAFEAVDLDGSGTVDEKELYSGLLLIHLKLGTYAGPAACRPLSRERCKEFFEKMDRDRSGTLDQSEFNQVMTVLFGNVLIRVLTQWSMTLIIVPLVANLILDGIQGSILWILNFIGNLDEHSSVADRIEVSLETSWQCLAATTPAPLLHFLTQLRELLSFVPESIWESIPLTFISTVLGLVVVPWLLLQIDAIFQAMADRRKAA
jgi:EF-hand domain pair